MKLDRNGAIGLGKISQMAIAVFFSLAASLLSDYAKLHWYDVLVKIIPTALGLIVAVIGFVFAMVNLVRNHQEHDFTEQFIRSYMNALDKTRINPRLGE